MRFVRSSAMSKHPREISAEDARQGRIILNTPLRQVVFFGALGVLVGLAIVLTFAAYG